MPNGRVPSISFALSVWRMERNIVIALCLDIRALRVGKHRSSVCNEVADETVADVIIGCSTLGSLLLDFSGYQ